MERYEPDDFVDEDYQEDAVLLNRVFTFYPSSDGLSAPVIQLWNCRKYDLQGEILDLAITRAKEIAGSIPFHSHARPVLIGCRPDKVPGRRRTNRARIGR